MKVLMIGAARSGQMLSSILLEVHPKAEIYFADDNKNLWGTEVVGHPVLSMPVVETLSCLEEYDYAFISIGIHKLMKVRTKFLAELKGKIPLINIIHPTAHISNNVKIGEGNYVGAFSYIGPYSVIGDCNYFSANSIIEHHATIGDLNSWGPSNATAGGCTIGNCVCMGTEVGMIYNVNIRDGSSIASGVLLCKDVGEGKVARKLNFPNFSISMDKRKDRKKDG